MSNIYFGNGGNISLGGVNIIKIKRWEASVNTFPVESSGFGDGGYLPKLSTGFDISGTAFGDLTDAGIQPTAWDNPFDCRQNLVAIVLEETSADANAGASRAFSFDGLITGKTVTRSYTPGTPSTIMFSFTYGGVAGDATVPTGDL